MSEIVEMDGQMYLLPEGAFAEPIDLSGYEPIGTAVLGEAGRPAELIDEDDAAEAPDEPEDVQLRSLDGTVRSVTIPLPPGAGRAMLVASGRDLARRLDTERAFELIDRELDRQNDKFGEQNLPLHAPGKGPENYREHAEWYRRDNDYRATTGELSWDTILLEEVFEALAEQDSSDELSIELIQVAAVAVRIWLHQRRKQLTDEDAIAVLRQLIGVQAAVNDAGRRQAVANG